MSEIALPGRSASNGPVPVPPQPPDGGPLVDVFVTTAVRTSDGPGPGRKRLPAGEAATLVGSRRAVYGDQPPPGFEDGGVRRGEAARMMPR